MLLTVTVLFTTVLAVSSAVIADSKWLPTIPGKSIVVITGCDSGFGASTSIELTARGYRVVSGCLTQAGADALSGKVSLAMVCDVTKDVDVNKLAVATAKLAAEEDLRLWAVVNNAGVAPLGYVDWMSMDYFQKAMDVNYFGLVRTTKALLPLLKKTKNSRIINISSVAGLGGGPSFGPYSASKHAVEGLSKCLRQELRPWGIKVCNVNPAFMKTPMVTEAGGPAHRAFMEAPDHVRRQYPEAEASMQRMNDTVAVLGEDPAIVVRQISRLVESRNPALVNWTGVQAAFLRIFLALPMWLQEWLAEKTVEVHGPSQEVLDSIRET
jgi:NAD(P)-dependent dehydrogenase (short-subunit alcohol dehydrogenase family)